MFPTLIGITIVVFSVMAAAPGGISAQSLVEGQNLEPQVKRAMEEYYNRLYGLNDSAPVQAVRAALRRWPARPSPPSPQTG
jgi:peptide/nickel transport system permease protein